ncbi:MAG: hypothetical protein Q4A55_02570 [Aerococcus sp.]|nr:hypothetical protein [Aerococcus sp.]
MNYTDDFYEGLLNELLPNTQLFARDVNLTEQQARLYQPGIIIKERGFTDATPRFMGMVTSHRFTIVTNHMVDISEFEYGTDWELHIANHNAHYKVLDVYEYHGKTQILLLHLPDDYRWKVFEEGNFSIEDYLIEESRKRFEAKALGEVAPEVAGKDWLERCKWPLGMSVEETLWDPEITIEEQKRVVDDGGFRDFYHQFIYVECRDLLLDRMTTQIAPDDTGLVLYGYMDDECDLMFQTVSIAQEQETTIDTRPVQDATYYNLKYEDIKRFNYCDLRYIDLDRSHFETTQQMISQWYDSKDEKENILLETRVLDSVRQIDRPLTFTVRVIDSSIGSDQVLVEIPRLSEDGGLWGILVTEPIDNMGVEVGDDVYVMMNELEDGGYELITALSVMSTADEDEDEVEEIEDDLEDLLFTITYDGKGLFARDLNLTEAQAEQYKPGLIIREKDFTDATSRFEGMITSHRMTIISDNMFDIPTIEEGRNLGWHISDRNAYYKVLDVYEYQGKTQILLLHLPEDYHWKYFKDHSFDIEAEFIDETRKQFEKKALGTIPGELTTQEWMDTCKQPLGLTEKETLRGLGIPIEELKKDVFNADFNNLYETFVYIDCLDIMQRIMPEQIEPGDTGLIAYCFVDDKDHLAFQPVQIAQETTNMVKTRPLEDYMDYKLSWSDVHDDHYYDIQYEDIDRSDFEKIAEAIKNQYGPKDPEREEILNDYRIGPFRRLVAPYLCIAWISRGKDGMEAEPEFVYLQKRTEDGYIGHLYFAPDGRHPELGDKVKLWLTPAEEFNEIKLVGTVIKE